MVRALLDAAEPSVSCRVDGGGAEHVVKDHCRAADNTGLITVRGRQDLQLAGRQGRRVAINGCAQSCYQDVVGLGHVTGDDQSLGVEQIDGTREDFADMTTAFADQPTRFWVAGHG